MFQVIPTWTVTYLPDGEQEQTLRVPEPNLEGLLHVLLFNHVHELHVMVERRWVTAIEEVETEEEADDPNLTADGSGGPMGV